ncbi:hypothetical protein [Butyrivibrio sp. XPD2006]|uniref:hypothetical protein n=1 Tax=Butyrivibrio sp. XPD2006 TaxID=1280668 RepID=UPI0003B4F8BC|nr:hypothetical protein [Butyrivibrio sp. XPD2006]
MNLTNDNDKMEMLNSILDEGESYQGTAIGTILPSAKTLLLFSAIGGGAAGALANTYCYIGITEKSLNMALINSINVSKMEGAIKIPLEKIEKTKVNAGGIRPSATLTCSGEKIKIAMTKIMLGSKVTGQKEGIQTICSRLSQIGG